MSKKAGIGILGVGLDWSNLISGTLLEVHLLTVLLGVLSWESSLWVGALTILAAKELAQLLPALTLGDVHHQELTSWDNLLNMRVVRIEVLDPSLLVILDGAIGHLRDLLKAEWQDAAIQLGDILLVLREAGIPGLGITNGQDEAGIGVLVQHLLVVHGSGKILNSVNVVVAAGEVVLALWVEEGDEGTVVVDVLVAEHLKGLAERS